MYPWELSFNVWSISELIISSFTNRPTLYEGIVEYWSSRRVSVFTLQNWPRTKYIPSWILKAEPVIAALLEIVVANGAPAEITVFPNNPEVILLHQKMLK